MKISPFAPACLTVLIHGFDSLNIFTPVPPVFFKPDQFDSPEESVLGVKPGSNDHFRYTDMLKYFVIKRKKIIIR